MSAWEVCSTANVNCEYPWNYSNVKNSLNTNPQPSSTKILYDITWHRMFDDIQMQKQKWRKYEKQRQPKTITTKRRNFHQTTTVVTLTIRLISRVCLAIQDSLALSYLSFILYLCFVICVNGCAVLTVEGHILNNLILPNAKPTIQTSIYSSLIIILLEPLSFNSSTPQFNFQLSLSYHFSQSNKIIIFC